MEDGGVCVPMLRFGSFCCESDDSKAHFSVKDTEESLFAWEMRLDVRSAVERYYIPL
jgi:hypothetical protein